MQQSPASTSQVLDCKYEPCLASLAISHEYVHSPVPLDFVGQKIDENTYV